MLFGTTLKVGKIALVASNDVHVGSVLCNSTWCIFEISSTSCNLVRLWLQVYGI